MTAALRRNAARAAAALALAAAAPGPDAWGQAAGAAGGSAYAFGACRDPSPAAYAAGPVRALHLPARDGVRLAVDVILPAGLPDGTRVPTVLNLTRYWRAQEGDGPREFQRVFASHGYAVVTADVRGTGASFGVWRHNRSRDEVLDYRDIVDWIIAQPWSDGRVGGWGISYGANTADWLAWTGHPAVKAVIPRSPDFDVYTDLYFPGGIFHFAFGKNWSDGVKSQDLNQKRGSPPRGVRPVDADSGGQLLREAVAARAQVPGVYEGLKEVSFRDDRPGAWGASIDDWSLHANLGPVERAGTAMYTWGSWMDAGTAAGVIHRFTTLRNPQRAVIGPWNHGARLDADPYKPAAAPVDPPTDVQFLEDVCFFDHHLKGKTGNGMGGSLLVYYTMGEDRWKTTTSWPPAGSTTQRWYLREGNALSRRPPATGAGSDRYTVDFTLATDSLDRWRTQRGGTDVVYGDQAAAVRGRLTYTTEPLPEDVEITGFPVVKLFVASSATDGAFFVYLEDVAPSGRVTHLTEGQLRALHRKVSTEEPPYRSPAPYHTFRRRDAAPLVPGEVAELHFGLLPTSVLVRKGHRLRIAIAGADANTFVRIPAEGTPTLRVHRDRERASYIEIPTIRPGCHGIEKLDIRAPSRAPASASRECATR